MTAERLHIVALDVRIGGVRGLEPFVTAALEGLEPGAPVPDPAPVGAALLDGCLAQLLPPARAAATVLRLGDTPALTGSVAQERAGDLAAAGTRAAALAVDRTIVLLASDGDEGVAVALAADGATPAIAALAGRAADTPGDLRLIPAGQSGDGLPGWPARALSPAVAALLCLAQGAICLHRMIRPARPRAAGAPPPAPTDRLALWPLPVSGVRRCIVGVGTAAIALVPPSGPRVPARARLADGAHVLLPFRAPTAAALADLLTAAACADDPRAAARDAFAAWQDAGEQPCSAALVAADAGQLRADTGFFATLLQSGDAAREWRTPGGSVLAGRPVRGKVAFVYPGFASAYVDAGRRLGYLFPQIQERLLARFGAESYRFLNLDRLSPRGDAPALDGDVRALSEATTAFAAIYTTLARDVFALHPQQAFGYSVGEAAMLFALGIWRDADTLAQRLDRSGLIANRLAGEMQAVRAHRQAIGQAIDPADPAWAAILVRAPLAEIAAAAAREGCFVPLINTAEEAVLAGDPTAVRRAIVDFAGRTMTLDVVLPLHCAAVRSERAAIAAHHDLPVTPMADVTLYSSGGGGDRLVQDRAMLAAAIGEAYTRPVDFPRLVRQAYADGARIFVEMGPRRICSSWVNETLAGRSHLAVPLDLRGVDEDVALLRGLAQLVAHQVPLRLDVLYEAPAGRLAHAAAPPPVPRLRLVDGLSQRIAGQIAAEVAAILDCAPEMIDRDAPLLGLGIDSIAIAGLAQRTEHDLGVRLDLADIVAAGTIQGLAELVHRRRLAAALARPVTAGEALRI